MRANGLRHIRKVDEIRPREKYIVSCVDRLPSTFNRKTVKAATIDLCLFFSKYITSTLQSFSRTSIVFRSVVTAPPTWSRSTSVTKQTRRFCRVTILQLPETELKNVARLVLCYSERVSALTDSTNLFKPFSNGVLGSHFKRSFAFSMLTMTPLKSWGLGGS